MPQDNNQLAAQEQQAPVLYRDMDVGQKLAVLSHQIDKRADQITTLLDGRATVAKFKQVIIMAVTKNPDLLKCTPKSVIESSMQCAADGFVPDGRQAALVPYGDTAQYLPMVQGIRDALARTGMILDIQTDVVYDGEHFINVQGTDSKLEHSPKLGQRGKDEDIIGSYALIRTIKGGLYKRALARSHIDKVRAASRARKGPWFDWFSEMAIKTALKNVAKSMPLSEIPGGDKIQAMLDRDNFLYELNPALAEAPKVQRLAHDPADEIPPDEPEQAQQKPQARQEPDKANPPKPEPKKQEEAPDTGPEPPLEDEAPAGQVQDAEIDDDDGFPGDRKAPPQEQEQTVAMPALVTKAMQAVLAATDWDTIEALMDTAWQHPRWPDVTADHRKTLYDLIKTSTVWGRAPATSEVYQRIREGK